MSGERMKGLPRHRYPQVDRTTKAGSLVEGELPEIVPEFEVAWEDVDQGPTRHDINPSRAPVEVKPQRRDLATRFGRGNRASKGRKPAMVKLGVPLSMCDVHDPRYRKLLRNAGSYRRFRCEELARAHGFLSAGASSMVASASLALAASKFMYTLAAEATDQRKASELVSLASKLSMDAMRAEQMAWEIAGREAAALKAMNTDKVPTWLQGKADDDEAKE